MAKPKAGKIDPRPSLVRQWALLHEIPHHAPGITAAVLAEKLRNAGFSVSKRTVERDLLVLKQAFEIHCNDAGEPYGWHWGNGKSLKLPPVDFFTALSLAVIEELLGTLLPAPISQGLAAKFSQARLRLGATKMTCRVNGSECVRHVPPSLPFIAKPIEPSILEAVQRSLVEGRQLEVRYSSPDAKPRNLTLHPLAFIQQGVVAYLLATTFDYDDPRLYAVHRINSAKVTERPSRRPAGFSLDEFLAKGGMQHGDGGLIELKAEVSNKLAYLLTETLLSADQKIVAAGNGRHSLTATIKDSWQLKFWILSQGAEITVLEPAELRAEIVSNLRDTLAAYGPG